MQWLVSQAALVVKNSPADAGDMRDSVLKMPWRGAWQPTPVLLFGKSRGQRSLAGYSPWIHKELDTRQVIQHIHTNTSSGVLGNIQHPVLVKQTLICSID